MLIFHDNQPARNSVVSRFTSLLHRGVFSSPMQVHRPFPWKLVETELGSFHKLQMGREYSGTIWLIIKIIMDANG